MPIATAAPTASDEAERGEVVGGDAGAAEVRRRRAASRARRCVRQRPSSMLAPGYRDAIRVPAGLPDRVHMRSPLRCAPTGSGEPEHLRTRGFVEDVTRRPRSATSPSWATAEPGRRRWPRRCCSRAGAITRLGRVEDGTTVSTSTPRSRSAASRSRSRSPRSSATATRSTCSTRPATPTSSATSHAALRVADLAVFVVSAVEGVEVQTEVVWRMARRARASRG